MKKNILKRNKGFTLIEMMIAIAIFLIVITIGVGALLNASAVHNKTKGMRSVLDSMTFTMEEMSRNLRTGHEYHCGGSGSGPLSCPGGGTAISFKSSQGTVSDEIWQYSICSIGTGNGICKSTGGGSLLPLTPPEVNIDSSSRFYVFGAETINDTVQPYVILKISGTINYHNTSTQFNLRTAVSQRAIDIPPIAP